MTALTGLAALILSLTVSTLFKGITNFSSNEQNNDTLSYDSGPGGVSA